jgi:hypothetical protein
VEPHHPIGIPLAIEYQSSTLINGQSSRIIKDHQGRIFDIMISLSPSRGLHPKCIQMFRINPALAILGFPEAITIFKGKVTASRNITWVQALGGVTFAAKLGD